MRTITTIFELIVIWKVISWYLSSKTRGSSKLFRLIRYKINDRLDDALEKYEPAEKVVSIRSRKVKKA